MITPISPMAKPLIAPSTAPNSMARAVPSPCAAEPKASPLDVAAVENGRTDDTTQKPAAKYDNCGERRYAIRVFRQGDSDGYGYRFRLQ